jgi:hypothetical protein
MQTSVIVASTLVHAAVLGFSNLDALKSANRVGMSPLEVCSALAKPVAADAIPGCLLMRADGAIDGVEVWWQRVSQHPSIWMKRAQS